jgi:hypothetical protein
VHRDIKPSNIWLVPQPSARAGVAPFHVKILDFGLAQVGSDSIGVTLSGYVVGTPAYMAPEQGRGQPVDARADLFSLGCVLYRLLSGELPFPGSSTMAMLVALAVSEPKPLRQLDPDLPPALEQLVSRLLAKKPGDRPASAGAVAEALTAIASALPADPAPNPTRKNRASAPASSTSVIPGQPVAVPTQARSVRFWGWIVAGSLGLALAVGLLAVHRHSTEQGDFVVETDDPHIEFQVGQAGVFLIDRKTGRTYEFKVVEGDAKAGKYELAVAEPASGLRFQTGTVTIQRGEKTAVRAWFEKSSSEDDHWLETMAGLGEGERLEAVKARLRVLNPGFTAEVFHQFDGDRVVEMRFETDKVARLAPLRALKHLRKLDVSARSGGESPLSDLSPLRGLKLQELACMGTQVADLRPLRGMPLTVLMIQRAQVADLTPLRGLKLTVLWCGNNYKLKALAGLEGMPLEELRVNGTPVADLSPLRNAPLQRLWCDYTQAENLTPLEGAPLLFLTIRSSRITDLAPLRKTKIEVLEADLRPEDIKFLQSIPTLKTVNHTPVSELK